MAQSGASDHPRTIGWLGTVSLAMGGSNQSLFLIGALLASQGSAAVPLLVAALLVSWAALPGWTELILMWPNRVGGIAASCAEAFRPYSPVLANLTGVCYWWGWVPTCGLTAILSAEALREWYLPGVPVHLLATGIVVVFMLVNLRGVRAATRVAIPIAAVAATLALLSALVPVFAGSVDWHRAFDFHLHLPFHGTFGAITSAMAGLYLIGFAAPAFEAAACHVGETKDPNRNVPRAMFGAAGIATLYFVVLPIVWLGTFGPHPLEGQLASALGPTFAPLLSGGARAAAIWFMVLNMFHGTLQPLAGAARTLSQLSEDGLLPRSWAQRNRFDVPWVTTTLTALMAILFLQTDDPTWVIAAANLAYLIGIAMPSIAVWLLRRNEPEWPRPYRAPRGTIILGVGAAGVWLTSTLLGFEQFGLPTVIASLALCYASAVLYAWRRWQDRRANGVRRGAMSLHFKLTAAMVAVVALDGAGYLIAINHVHADGPLVAALKDIFVGVALLTVNVGLVIPGIISNAVSGIAAAARRLAEGTLAELTAAMQALGRGDLETAKTAAEVVAVRVRTRDELGEMASSFNLMQVEVGRTAAALNVARDELRVAKFALARTAGRQATVARLGLRAMEIDDLQRLLEEIATAAQDVVGADSCAILEYAGRAATVRLRAGTGIFRLRSGSELEPGAAGRLRLAPGGVLAVEDWCLEPAEDRASLLQEGGARATLGVAIAERGRVFGALAVNFRAPRTFSADELDTIQAIANLLASATERDRASKEVRHRALHDPLTGLPNRTLFVDRLRQSVAASARRGRAAAVLFLDLDHFKFVNDSLGHSAGDELLRAIAGRLERSMRPGDTVARFGGDEFLIICDDLGSQEDAEDVATDTIELLKRPFQLLGAEHSVAVSVGISIATDAERVPEDLIREADAAMYQAKEAGRDGYAVYDELMRATAIRRLSIESELRVAIERDELRLAYQPLVSLSTGRIEGVEALVRWQHPRRGLLTPDEFIPVAEQTGAILGIGRWVLQAAVGQAARWHERRPERRLPVAVNLSARQVTHHELLPTIANLLARYELPPELLHLEITESALLDPTEVSIDRLRALKALGVGVVLDDFGTGYSSLAYVKRFPIDTLKIDRAFIAEVADTRRDSSIVAAIIAMAHGLRVSVVAEGVETTQQARTLLRMGCEIAQGHLFSRAVWPEEIDDLIESGTGTRELAVAAD
jgi:diguanylate cyclase (GGDEF)-like protein